MFRQLRILGPFLVVGAGLAGLVVFLVTGSSGSDNGSDGATQPDPVVIEADSVYDFDTMDELIAASDLIVRARVVDTAKGDVIGADGADPASAAIVVRDVTLRVDEVFAAATAAGAGPAVADGDRIVVAEEGWLASGEPLIIDGLGPSAEGDDAIWFLQAVPAAGPDEPGYIVINSQGRYLIDDDDLRGADGDDLLVKKVESLGADGLIEQLRTR
ncbi:hypothetical protein BH10ACT3_BH10ACT3_13630 [soil metagenome]